MTLKKFKKLLLLPQKEIPLYKTIHLLGTKMVLLSLTQEKYGNKLWVLYEDNSFSNHHPSQERHTNRELLLGHIKTESQITPFAIKTLWLQGQKVKFAGGNASPLMMDQVSDVSVAMLHFLKSGHLPKSWMKKKAENLAVAQLRIANRVLPKLNRQKPMKIHLRLNDSMNQVPVQFPFPLDIGQPQRHLRFDYPDPSAELNGRFYINSLDILDPWDTGAAQESGNAASHAQGDIYRQICPKGMVIPLLHYETEDGRQLICHTQQYLNAAPQQSCTGGMSSCYGSDKASKFGYPVLACPLEPVPKEFSGSLEAELFAYYHHEKGCKILV